MFDNITLIKVCKPPIEFFESQGEPYKFKDHCYTPRFDNAGNLKGYQTKIKNLMIYVGETKSTLKNSLHKYYHNGNWNDFYLCEVKSALALISDTTGINWFDATANKIEYGCNIIENATSLVTSLKSYKAKDYHAMVSNGVKYGVSTEVKNYYKAKGYNKTLEVLHNTGTKLKDTIFRWEIVAKRKHLQRLFGKPMTMHEMLQPAPLSVLVNDALMIYNSSIRIQQVNFDKLSVHEQHVYAVMTNEQIKNNFKIHHKESFKKYRKVYKLIMINPNNCSTDKSGGLLEEKFNKLINDFSACSILETGVR